VRGEARVPWVVSGRNVGSGGRRSQEVMVMGRNVHEGGPQKGTAMGSCKKGLVLMRAGSEGILGGVGGVT
jgi:hypothetical protein